MPKYRMICDVCGFKYWNHDLRRNWKGLYVCRDDWEPRHPQDYVRGVPDDQTVPVSRPEAADDFLAENEVTEGSL